MRVYITQPRRQEAAAIARPWADTQNPKSLFEILADAKVSDFSWVSDWLQVAFAAHPLQIAPQMRLWYWQIRTAELPKKISKNFAIFQAKNKSTNPQNIRKHSSELYTINSFNWFRRGSLFSFDSRQKNTWPNFFRTTHTDLESLSKEGWKNPEVRLNSGQP